MNIKTLSRLTIALIAGLTISILPTFSASADVPSAISYLNSKTPNPWAIMAESAAGQSPSAAYLKTFSGTKAIDLEAPILAMTAAGDDPRTFTGTDLVAALKGYYSGGQIGDAGAINSDIFGILALSSAGVPSSDAVISGTKSFMLSNQNADGGWSFSVGGTSDTNTTAGVIMALLEAGVPSSDSHITSAVTYLKSSQNSDGGFPYDPKSQYGTASDASSDSWVISALNKLGVDPHTWSQGSSDPISNLLSFQAQSGYFQFQTGTGEDSFTITTTSYAVVALSGKSYPVAKISQSSAQPAVNVTYRIEGSSGTVCSGSISAVTAMDVVRNSSSVCNFTYNIQSTSYGPYLNQIGGDSASGSIGWMYMVDSVSPPVGAADYNLKTGDDVLWFFGDFSWKPTEISVSSTQIASGAPITVTVNSLESSGWSPLSGATIYAGTNSTTTTNSSGVATLNLPDGNYKIYASKDGYIRSATKLVVIGNSTQTTINLTATISGSGGNTNQNQNPGSVSFSVDTGSAGNSVGFGSLSAGSNKQSSITLKNSGQTNISIVSTVTGDDVFTNYLTIDNMLWNMFNTVLAPSVNKTSQLKLSIPSTYTGSGSKSGSLIFWATPIQ